MTSQEGQAYLKPLPEMEPEEKPYWENLKAHAMKVQRCKDCESWFFPPRAICPHCLSADYLWTPVSGRGQVYAICTFHHSFHPSYTEEDVPYNVSIVELEEGVRVMTNVVGCPVEEVKISMPVEAVYEDVTDEVTLVKFRPAP